MLHCLLTGISSKIKKKGKITPEAPINESGHVQMIRVGKSISYTWVKRGPDEDSVLGFIYLQFSMISYFVGSYSD